jgi:D-sedoheptulose 7-phosphate isomerase
MDITPIRLWDEHGFFLQICKTYIDGIRELLRSIDLTEVECVAYMLHKAYERDAQVFVLGNGGSASTASHFACDLGKGTTWHEKPRFRVISLNDNMALLTAYANDCGYENTFKEQLVNLLNPDDILIAISASGNSENVVRAVEYARDRGATTIGFLGFDGGRLSEIVDYKVWVNESDYGKVEDTHMILTHLISRCLKEKLECYDRLC